MNGPEHWPIATPTGSVASRTVDVWAWTTGDVSPATADTLPTFESENLATMSHPVVRQRAIASTIGMRQILAAYCGKSAAELEIVRSDYGKPSLAETHAIEFNLTHSGDWILLAVAGKRVGIDLETPRELRDARGLARRILTDAEFANWSNHSEDERERAFFRLWTQKEAVTKFDGRGLQLSMATIALNGNEATWHAGHCYVRLLFDAESGIASIATSSSNCEVHCQRWDTQLNAC